jgi:hypothetical protein
MFEVVEVVFSKLQHPKEINKKLFLFFSTSFEEKKERKKKKGLSNV